MNGHSAPFDGSDCGPEKAAHVSDRDHAGVVISGVSFDAISTAIELLRDGNRQDVVILEAKDTPPTFKLSAK